MRIYLKILLLRLHSTLTYHYIISHIIKNSKVLKSNINNLDKRRAIETDMIHLILSVCKKIINKRIPYKYKISHLIFL